MVRTPAQQFANHTLPERVLADPLAFASAIASDNAASVLAPGYTATIEKYALLYSIVIITPPAPRENGDPAAIMICGRGDGTTKFSAVGYYVLWVENLDGPTFKLSSRDGGEKPIVTIDGPLPDPRYLAEYAFALYMGNKPEVRDLTADIPHLPAWYWWYTFNGTAAMQKFIVAKDDKERFAAVRAMPMLLMPEIVDTAEEIVGPLETKRLRDMKKYLQRDLTMGPAWRTLVERLANTTGRAPGLHTTRALELIAEPREHGALSMQHAYELEAFVRCKIAVLGIAPDENYRIAQELATLAGQAQVQAAKTAGPEREELKGEDALWKKLFLDDTDLPDASLSTFDEDVVAADPVFLHYGGTRAAHVVWSQDESNPLGHLIDSRWVFRTSFGAKSFVEDPATAKMFSAGLPPVAPPQLGDDQRAFGGEAVDGRRTQIVVIRVGRVVARLQATEGVHASASRQILHAALVHPLALRIFQRCQEGIGAYWLHVAQPTNAVPALVHSPGYDVARLLDKYPLLALAELPKAIATMGETYAPVARSLASFQAQLRAHRWQTYRLAMLALVRALVETDMGDTRVNAAYALEIVYELGHIDPDPVWRQLAATCEARL